MNLTSYVNKIILSIFLLSIYHESSAQWINTANVDLGATPPTLRVKGTMMDFDLSKMVITQTPLNDADNTQVICLRFKCVGVDQNIAPYDTTFALNSVFPFALRIYGISDTSTTCYHSFPPNPQVYDSVYLSASQILSADEIADQSQLISLYPNPTNGIVTIEAGEATRIQSISVYSILGQLVLSQKGGSKTLDVRNLPPGLYSLILHTDKGMLVEKLLLEK